MNIVFAASEAVPFCKTGGLADVAGALPKALARKGARVSLVLPYYRAVRCGGFKTESLGKVPVPFNGEAGEAEILRAESEGFDSFFIDCPRYFDRDGIYGPKGGGFEDNAARYAFFSRAVIETVRSLRLSPDVFHCHDWHTALIPVYLSALYEEDAALSRAGTLLTIHNLAYQGSFGGEVLGPAGLAESAGALAGLKHNDGVSYLKGGLASSDILNAVSPTYAREIQTEEYGCGLEGLLRKRRGDLYGVLNGLDLETWDPAVDAALARPYQAGKAYPGKAECKAALQKECGFDVEPDALMLGSVTRLDHQKGLDVALEVLPALLEKGAQYVLVGTGDPDLEKGFAALEKRFPRRVHIHATFDDPFARRVYAGADVFLMPSRFEPCGLGQMIAMRYGTLPVATRTGGLADTVSPHGFLAAGARVPDLARACEETFEKFLDKPGWRRRVLAAMETDFGWDRSADEYLGLYAKAQRAGHGISG